MNITGVVKYIGKLGTGGNSSSMFVGLKLDQPGKKETSARKLAILFFEKLNPQMLLGHTVISKTMPKKIYW